MSKPVDWKSIAVPLDVQGIDLPADFVRRWLAYEPTETGLVFECETESGRQTRFRVDVVEPDVIRLRMAQGAIREAASDILIRDERTGPATPFEVEENGSDLVLTTGRLRLEFARYPWQMRAYDAQDGSGNPPFFRQQCDDRAYGPYYEVPPTGFDQGDDGRLTVRETVAVSPGEAFYGLGERFTALNKWGQELVSWAIDSGNVSSHRSYKNVPFFMSTAGYGVFVHSSFPMVYRMGTESSISYSFHVDDSQLDYFLIYGPGFEHILQRYAALTGQAPVPPKWSFGFWISRAGYRTRDEVESIIVEMRARDFPCDVISLDPWWMGDCDWCTYEWDRDSFPEPEEMIRELRAQGVRTCLWVTPYVAAGCQARQEGMDKDFFVHGTDGGLAPVTEAFAGRDLVAVDVTNPEAIAWLQSKLSTLLDMGVAVFKTDFGEQAPVDAVYHDGRSGLEMHNLYPLLYNGAVFELTRRRFGRGLTWGRSAYAGSQRYPVQWGGDSYSSLDQMAGQIRGLLSYGMSGVPFCSHDVGGFDYPPQTFDHSERDGAWFLKDHGQNPTAYARWLQFGAFSSHMRAHGKQPREPWAFGHEVEEIARRYLKLRYRLLPYIYSQAVKSSQSGLPVVRPMVLAFQSDPTTHCLDLQYMFGDSFLVAPVVNGDGRCRVYLPEGEWLDYWTKEVVSGPRWLDVQAPLDVLPLWVRAGAIIALGPEMAHVDQKPLDPLTLELYRPLAEAETLVRDEDRPDIPVHYFQRGENLTVEVGPAPGDVELVLYGVTIAGATVAGESQRVHEHPGGQRLRFPCTRGTVVSCRLG